MTVAKSEELRLYVNLFLPVVPPICDALVYFVLNTKTVYFRKMIYVVELYQMPFRCIVSHFPIIRNYATPQGQKFFSQ